MFFLDIWELKKTKQKTSGLDWYQVMGR